MKKVIGILMIVIGGITTFLGLLATITGLPKLFGNPQHLAWRVIGYFGASTLILSIALLLIFYGMKLVKAAKANTDL